VSMRVTITNLRKCYGRAAAVVVLEMSVESDFADLFDVKSQRLPRRGSLQSVWDERRRRLTTRYENGGFRRGLRLQIEEAGAAPEFSNGGLSFRIVLEPGGSWHTCLLWMPELDGGKAAAVGFRNSSGRGWATVGFFVESGEGGSVCCGRLRTLRCGVCSRSFCCWGVRAGRRSWRSWCCGTSWPFSGVGRFGRGCRGRIVPSWPC